jgi:hypothetical protein
MYYRLYDLPAVERHRIGCEHANIANRSRPTLLYSGTIDASTTAERAVLRRSRAEESRESCALFPV